MRYNNKILDFFEWNKWKVFGKVKIENMMDKNDIKRV
jgi:hypothetical protein